MDSRDASKEEDYTHKEEVKVGSRDQKTGVNLDNQIITLNLHLSG